VPSRPSARRSALCLVALALGALALPSLSSAAPAPSQDSVVGGINSGGGGIGFFISADVRSGPSGENPSGTFAYSIGSPTNSTNLLGATISCLAVNGNTAVVGGSGVLRSVGAGPNGFVITNTPTGFIAIITDNGDIQPPAPGQPFPMTPDTLKLEFLATPDCAAPPSIEFGFTGFGGFIVVDAQPPLPTAKDQCKDGGWKHYGTTFKNQGQCVAFVQRGPKP
jgi:hypothetical protein